MLEQTYSKKNGEKSFKTFISSSTKKKTNVYSFSILYSFPSSLTHFKVEKSGIFITFDHYALDLCKHGFLNLQKIIQLVSYVL